jgi:hypothetical protein
MIYEKTGDYKRSTNYLDETRTSLPYTLKSGDIIPIMNEVLMSVRGTKVESEFLSREQETPPPSASPRTPLVTSNTTLSSPQPDVEQPQSSIINPNQQGTRVETSFVPKQGSVRQRAQAIGQKKGGPETNKGGKSKRLIRAPDEVRKTVSAPRAARNGTLRRHVASNNANKTLKIHSLS